MMALFAKLVVKAGNEDRFLTLLRADAEGTRKEPGCLRFDVIRDRERANVYYLYEVYKDPGAFEEHQKQPHFRVFFEESGSLLEGPPEASFGEVAAL
jgi:autoinducer 2-degrading protein